MMSVNRSVPIRRSLVAVMVAMPVAAALGQDTAGKNDQHSSSPKLEHAAASPDWARDAKWYYVVVSRFRNGDKGNDPASAAPWSAEWTERVDSTHRGASAQQLGGDLQGLRSKLPYLKALGVNTLCLSPIFSMTPDGKGALTDLRHIDDTYGVANSVKKIAGESSDPTSWQRSDSDRLFIKLVQDVHLQGFRIVLEVADVLPLTLEQHLSEALARWMDPNRDGKQADGVDGWMLAGPLVPAKYGERWSKAVRKINPDAVIISNGRTRSGAAADGVFTADVGNVAQYIFAKLLHVKGFAESGDRQPGRDDNDQAVAASQINALTDSSHGRSRSLIAAKNATASKSTEDATKGLPVLRLAYVLQHFLPGAPMTYYGDEVGMYAAPGVQSDAPMWWNDLPGKQTKAAAYREDFQSLIQWLHLRRDLDEPLRRGEFRTLLADDDRRVLVLARTMPNKDVVLVMNYGDKKQKVMVPVGTPGEMIAILSPYLVSSPRARKLPAGPEGIRPLPMGGSKQVVNNEGDVRVWIEPMAVRYVLRESH